MALHQSNMERRQVSESAGKNKTNGRTAAGNPVQNAVLEQMPQREFSILEPHLEFKRFSLAEYLEREGSPINDVYFLNAGVASMVIETQDARSVEVGITGCEDMIGLPLAAGLIELTYSVIVQAPGTGFKVTADVMKRLLPAMPQLTRMLLRRLAIRSVEQAQNTACNRLHNLKQRLARWLLLNHDRLPSGTIQTTHDFLSKMAGTDRATVSLAIADFERKGILQRGRGAITIIDRRKLEAQSCECYGMFSQFNAELGLKTKHPPVG
jgi:CRP-like cAMP-binding protein